MEHLNLFQISKTAARHLITRAVKQYQRGYWRRSEFNALPTAMLFRPNKNHEGSLHYMHFPALACQRFHYHPSSRYLILFGDVDIYIHYSNASLEQDPNLTEQVLVIPNHTFSVVRFESCFWHKFETKSEEGLGLIAFSFHGNDNIDDFSKINDDLMEEVTIFWEQ